MSIGPELADFLAHSRQLAEEHGVELDHDDTLQLLKASQAGGFNAAATEQAFGAMFADYEADAGDDAADGELDWDDSDDGEEEELSPGDQALADDLGDDVKRLTGRLGRPLRQDEKEAFVRNATEQVRRTGNYDRDKAGEGLKGYSDMTRDEANEAMVTRARELEGPQPEPDENRVYDLSNRDDWQEYATLRLQGGMSEDDFADVDLPRDEAA